MRTGDYLQRLLIHDLSTFEHCVRVARNLRAVANFLELEPVIANQLVLAGLLHDIGKLEVNREILTSPHSLDNFGKRRVQQHSRTGREISISLGMSELVQELVVSHHEPGYPRARSRERDSFFDLKQHLQLADRLDAIKSRRSYKPEYSDLVCREVLIDEGFREDLIELLLRFYSKGSSD